MPASAHTCAISTRAPTTSVMNSRRLDHLVSAHQKCFWNRQAKRLRRFQVYNQLEFGRLLDRSVGGLVAFENAAGVDPDHAKSVRKV
jgi:hypothetical protein